MCFNNDTPQRKKNRLDCYDYSTAGAYFITVCTKERQNYFWNSVGATIGRPQDVELSPYGKIVDDAINNISNIYPSISVEQYVIMSDHVHLLLLIHADDCGRPMVAPTISRVVQQLKGYVTKRLGASIWQKLFFDHVIRNEQDYEEHVRYIFENPLRWHYDKLYSE
ncbi:MAG: transposase [Clostridia bacterium]|nr:transposase [Clostridia bacterium]